MLGTVILLHNKFKNLNQKGLSLIEALVSTAIVGIGFVAVFQMVNFSINSINTSGERTKANYLVSMVAEGFIGYKDSIGGLSEEDRDKIYYRDGKAYITDDGRYQSDDDIECMKFSEYYLHLGGSTPGCDLSRMTNIDKDNKENLSHDKTTNISFGSSQYGEQKVSIRDCPERGNDTSQYKPIHGEGTSTYKDAPRNKIQKWLRLLAEDRAIKCKSRRDFRTVEIFEMCIWKGADSNGKKINCQIYNENVLDESMYVGRIQINLNDGKKRKFLYFQSDYKIKQTGCDGTNCGPTVGPDESELTGTGG